MICKRSFQTVLPAVYAVFIFTFCPILSAENKKAPAPGDIPAYSPPQKGFFENLVDLFIPHYEKRHVIYKKESEYFLITVEDDESGRRHLVFNPNHGSQGIILPSEPDKIVPNFLKYSFLAYSAGEKVPERVLFIGLGAGIMPRFIAGNFPGTNIDIVELDKAVPEIAEKYFGFKVGKNMHLIIEDGRYYVNRSGKKYDLIVIDAYNSKEIPFQFTTVEFFEKVKGMLSDGGLVVANIANFGRKNFISSEFATVKSVFKNIGVVLCPYKTNYVLFASDKITFDIEQWKKKSAAFDKRYKWDFSLLSFLDSALPPGELKKMTEKAKILSDDYAPVNDMD